MRTTRITAGALALAFTFVLLVASVASAQLPPPLPLENHYKVYASSPITVVKPVGLRDQFGQLNVLDMVFDKFATPADKIVINADGTSTTYPMVNPDIHMDWYRIDVPQVPRTVIGTDQFGKGPWVLGNARYLLLPALKNVPVPATVPAWNHYLCYDALSGPLVNKPVTLIDQFGNVQVVVLQAKYFCNPVEKTVDGAVGPVVYPIIDFNAHLACYQVDNPVPDFRGITTVDQFGYWSTQIYHNDCLCVPALKDYPLATQHSTWGKIKSLYRN